MKKFLWLSLLVLLNFVLAGWLVAGLKQRPGVQPNRELATQSNNPISLAAGAKSRHRARDPVENQAGTAATTFSAVYADDPKHFAANLRAIGCPEETVKDILAAEIHRRFQAQEDALRPKPADHVPWSWSANTTEPKLVERRQQAASLFREEADRLREALGYEVSLTPPLYARTLSDVRFEETLGNMDAPKRNALKQANDDYWAGVQALQQSTKGFWLAQDVGELLRLKARRRQTIAVLMETQ
jgi:hypothetical protein